MECSVHSMTKIAWEQVTNILVASCGVDRRPLALWVAEEQWGCTVGLGNVQDAFALIPVAN